MRAGHNAMVVSINDLRAKRRILGFKRVNARIEEPVAIAALSGDATASQACHTWKPFGVMQKFHTKPISYGFATP